MPKDANGQSIPKDANTPSMPKDINTLSMLKDTINQWKEVGSKQKNKQLIIKPNTPITTKNQHNLLDDGSEEECVNEESCSGDKNLIINSTTPNQKNKEKNYDLEKENFSIQRK